MSDPVKVTWHGGWPTVSTDKHRDMIGHVYNRRSDREILKELWNALTSARSGGA